MREGFNYNNNNKRLKGKLPFDRLHLQLKQELHSNGLYPLHPPPPSNEHFTVSQLPEVRSEHVRTHLDNALYLSPLQSYLSMSIKACHCRIASWFCISS